MNFTSPTFLIAVGLILTALTFDFLNGFHDAANSIATVVSTRVLSPGQAVVWAAFFNFVAAFGFGVGVAKTVGSGMIDIKAVDSKVIFAGRTKTLLFIVLSPVIGMLLGVFFMTTMQWVFRGTAPSRVDKYFRRLQLLSAALFSLGHGTNDAQKTMGIIAGVLFTGGYLKTFDIPFWVVLMAHAAIGLGTLSGGCRIVRTMGQKITALRPVGGFSAETAGAISIIGAAWGGIPVSTTHTITGAIVGVGATRRVTAVKWGVTRRIVWAWIITIPAAAGVAALSYSLIR